MVDRCGTAQDADRVIEPPDQAVLVEAVGLLPRVGDDGVRVGDDEAPPHLPVLPPTPLAARVSRQLTGWLVLNRSSAGRKLTPVVETYRNVFSQVNPDFLKMAQVGNWPEAVS